MAINDSKKYYWLKLKEDFFEEDTISWLEEQDNGVYYSNFYLKLCLKSLKTGGVLIRNVGEILIPYDISKLAEITRVNKDTAIVAMELFKKIGLVQILENGEIYLSQLNNMVGAETKAAERMRKSRANKQLKASPSDKCNNVTPMLQECSPEKEIEKEIEIEIEKDIEIEKELQQDNNNKSNNSCSSFKGNLEVFKHFEKCGFAVTAMLMEQISADIEVYNKQWLMDAATEAMNRGKINNYKYVLGILQNWTSNGRNEGNGNGATSKNNREEPAEWIGL